MAKTSMKTEKSDEDSGVAEESVRGTGRFLQLSLQRDSTIAFGERMKERVATNGDPKPAWVISFTAADPGLGLTGELTIAESAVGMNLNNRPFLQSTTDPQVAEESPQLPGLLIAMNQLRRLLSGDVAAFTEQQAAGRTFHLPLERGGCSADTRGSSHLSLVL